MTSSAQREVGVEERDCLGDFGVSLPCSSMELFLGLLGGGGAFSAEWRRGWSLRGPRRQLQVDAGQERRRTNSQNQDRDECFILPQNASQRQQLHLKEYSFNN